MGWEEGDHRGKVQFSSHPSQSTFYQHGMSLPVLTLTTWLQVVFVRFLCCNYFSPLPSLLYFLEGSPYAQSRGKDLRAESLYNSSS